MSAGIGWTFIACRPAIGFGCRIRLKATRELGALVCFETTGGQEWTVWSALDAAGIATRQLPPAQIKAFAASRGTRAKTDRIDAELIARFMAFRPDTGRNLPHEKLRLLRALASKRGPLVEARKRLLAQIKAQGTLGLADMFDVMDAELKDLLDRQIAELEAQIEQTIASEDDLPETAALAGLAPIARDSGAMRGKRTIGGGRRHLRHFMFQAALVASHHNLILKPFADRLRTA